MGLGLRGDDGLQPLGLLGEILSWHNPGRLSGKRATRSLEKLQLTLGADAVVVTGQSEEIMTAPGVQTTFGNAYTTANVTGNRYNAMLTGNTTCGDDGKRRWRNFGAVEPRPSKAPLPQSPERA